MLITSISYSQSQNQKNKFKKASVSEFSDRQWTENGIANLVTGIKSDNLGLRKSAIYLAGLYQISETVPTLIDQLKKEENAEVKVLTALVLYRLEDPRGIEAIENLYMSDENARVKRISKAILDEFKNKLVVTEVSGR
jgi:HEAT repeat protein